MTLLGVCPTCARKVRVREDALCACCGASGTVARLHEAIMEAAGASTSIDSFRDAALAITAATFEADVGVFATVQGRTVARSAFGLPQDLMTRVATRWNVYGRDMAPVDARARELGAATDRRTLGAALERTDVYRELIAPANGGESLLLGLTFGGRRLGLFMLARTGRRSFSDAELAIARPLAKTIAISCAALAPPDPPDPLVPLGLSGAEIELMRYLELGYTSREIAVARGTSFYTVRNQLSALYRKLGVANRTEAVGLRIVTRGT